LKSKPHIVFYALAAIAAVAFAAFAGLGGLSLAHWTDEVDLQGQASMGTLVWDIIPPRLPWNTNHTMRFSASVRDSGDGPGEGEIDINITKAYPLAYGTLLLEVRNEGSIPVHVKFWIEPAPTGSCTNDAVLDYILLNPAFDAPYYNGINNTDEYSVASVRGGWTDPWTHPVSWWTSNHGSPATALSIEDVMASGKVLKLSVNSTTIVAYDDDAIIMPGEKHAIFIWIGISDALQDHEELMGASCQPAFTIHYIATQAVP
jgi:hypothetical protein